MANALGDVRTITMPIDLPDSFKLELRIRYETPYPGLGSDSGPDGSHVPHWLANVGGKEGITIEDNTVFNGLLVMAGKSKEQRVDGTRPQDKWMQYTFIRHGTELSILIDGLLVQTAKVPEGPLSGLSITVMHEKLWLSDLQIIPYTPPAIEAAPPTDPDFLLQENFTDGHFKNAWQTSGTWQLVADPDNPAKHVLFTDPHGQYDARITTVNPSFSDYTLQFHTRMDTAYKAWPANDSTHHPTWGVLLNHVAKGGETMALDRFIWNNMCFSDGGHESGGHDRVIARGKWADVRLICLKGKYDWFIDGKQVSHAEGSELRQGSIGFQAMDCSLWIAEILATAHPDAIIYATFGDQPDAAKLSIAPDDQIVAATPDNRALRLTHELIGHVAAAEYVLSFKLKPQGVMAPWSLVLGHDAAHGEISIAIDPAAGTTTIAREQDGKVISGDAIPLEAAAIPLLKSPDWASYRILRTGQDISMSINGQPVLTTHLPLAEPAGFVIRQHGGVTLVDDVLMQPLPEPYVRMEPVQEKSIYTASEPKGFDVHLRNTDVAAHTVTIAYAVTNSHGDEVDQGQSNVTLNPGDDAPIQPLRFKLDRPINGTAQITMKSDGRVFKTQTSVITVLSDLLKLSVAYEPRIGFNVGNNDAGVAFRAGAMWMRSNSVIDSVRKIKDGYDFIEGEALLKKQQSLMPGARFMNLHQGDNVANLLNEADDFADLAGATAQHFAGRANYYEIWNEPNHSAFWRQALPNGSDYAVVLKESYNAIKRNDPNAIVIGGATSGTDVRFIRQIFEAGGGPYMDWLCYHPYGYPKRPEDLIVQAALNAKAVNDDFGGWTDHFISEHGYVTTLNASGLDEPTQANYIARTHLLASTLPFMRAVVFYRLEDFGTNTQDVESRFGELHPDGSPKPAFLAVANIARQLANTEYLGRLQLGDGVYGLVYRAYDGDVLISLWALKAQTVSLAVAGDDAAGNVTDLLANSVVPIIVQKSHLELSATESPLFIRLKKGGEDLARSANQETVRDCVAALKAGTQQIKNSAAAESINQVAESLISADGQIDPTAPKNIGKAIAAAYANGALTREQAAMLAERAYLPPPPRSNSLRRALSRKVSIASFRLSLRQSKQNASEISHSFSPNECSRRPEKYTTRRPPYGRNRAILRYRLKPLRIS